MKDDILLAAVAGACALVAWNRWTRRRELREMSEINSRLGRIAATTRSLSTSVDYLVNQSVVQQTIESARRRTRGGPPQTRPPGQRHGLPRR